MKARYILQRFAVTSTRSGLVNFGDKRLGVLVLLVKLDVLGVRKVSYSYASIAGGGGWQPPKCAIEMAVVSLSRDFAEFVPKKKYPGEDWMVV
jgi:hypothetical protein